MAVRLRIVPSNGGTVTTFPIINISGFGQDLDSNSCIKNPHPQFRFACSDFSADSWIESNKTFVARDIQCTYKGVNIKAPLFLYFIDSGEFHSLCYGTILQDSILITATKKMGYSYSADVIDINNQKIRLSGNAKFYKEKGRVNSFEANVIEITLLD